MIDPSAPVRILLAEDDPRDAARILDILGRANPFRFELIHAESVADAAKRLEEVSIDIILLDLTLPDANGMKALHEMRRLAGRIPVIVLADLDDSAIAMKAVREGAQDYLVKGQISSILLTRTVRYAIERRKNQDSLTELEETLNLLLSRTSEAVFVLDEEGNILHANPAAEKIFGCRQNEMRSSSLDVLIPGSVKRIQKYALERYVTPLGKKSTPSTLETTGIYRDGREISLEISFFQVERGGKQLFSVVARDITEKKQSYRALLYKIEFEKLIADLSTKFINIDPDEIDSEITEALRAIGEFAEVDRCAVFRVNDSQDVAFNTHEWCAAGVESKISSFQSVPADAFRWASERLLRFEFIHIARISDLPPEAEAERAFLVAHSIRSRLVIPMVSGKTLIGLVTFDCIKSEKRWPDEIIVLLKLVGEIFANALDRKKAEDSLRVSERKFRSLFENVLEGVYQSTADGRFLIGNPALVRMLGFDSYEQLLACNINELYVRTEERAEWLTRLEQAGELRCEELLLRRKDGETIYVLDNARAVKDEKGNIAYYEGMLTDITERKLAEHALLESIQFNEEVISDAGEGIVVYDRDFNYIIWNPFMEKITGLPADEVLGRNAIDLFPHLKEQGVIVLLERALAGERVHSQDVHYHVGSTGKSGWVVGTYGPHKNSRGEITGVIAIISDVTERKRAEEGLLQREIRLGLLNSISEGVLSEMTPEEIIERTLNRIHQCFSQYRVSYSIVDPDGLFTMVDSVQPPGFVSMKGFKADTGLSPQLLASFRKGDGMPVPDIKNDDRFLPFLPELERARVRAVLDYPLPHSDGFTGILCFHAQDVHEWTDHEISSLKEVAEILSVFIRRAMAEQERRLAEKALRESETRYRLVARATNNAVWDWDLAANTVQWGDAAGHAFGYEGQTVQGCTWWKELVHPEDLPRVQASIQNILDSGEQFWSAEYRFRRADGTYAFIEDQGYVVHDPSGAAIRMIGAMKEVTEQKQAAVLQSALYRIAEKTGSAEDMQEFYAAIHSIVAELMYARNFYIALTDKESGDIKFAYFVDEFDSLPPKTIPPKGLTVYMMRTGQPMLVTPEIFEKLVARGEVESHGSPSVDWLGVPLKRGDKTFGGLVVQSYTENIRFGEKEKEVLTFVSQHIATAVERKAAQEALRQGELRLRSLVGSIDEIVFELDEEGRFLNIWTTNEELLAYPKEQLIGNLLSDFWPEEKMAEAKAAFQRVLRTGHAESLEYWLDLAQGRHFFLARISAIPSASGGYRSLCVLVRDVTDRKKGEHELEQSLSLLQATLESTADGILVVDRSGKWISYNHKFVEMWRIPEAILQSKDEAGFLSFVRDKVVDPDAFVAMVKDLYNRPDDESYDIVKFKDGRIFERYSHTQLIGGKSAGRVWSFSDVTEAKRAEAIQSALYRIADKTGAAKDIGEFYTAIHSIVGELMYARNFYIALYDKTKELLDFPYFVDEADVKPEPVGPQKGLTEYVLKTGQPLLASPEIFEKLVDSGDVEAVGPPSVDWLGVPLKTAGKTFGVLVVQSYTDSIRFGEKEKEVLTFVSQHIATALERKQAQEALSESSRRFRDMLENVELVSVLLDQNGNITFVNDYLLRLTGYDPEQVIGKNWFTTFIAEEDKDALESGFMNTLPAGSISAHHEHHIVTATGERRLIAWNNTVLRNSDGDIIGMASIGSDITEKRRMADALEASLSLLKATLESTADGILVVDGEGKITAYNQRFGEMWHIPRIVLESRDDNEALRYVLDQLRDPDEFISKVRELYLEPEAESHDIIYFKDGRVFERYSRPQWIAGKTSGRVWSFSDITERKRAEESFRETAERYALAALGANDGLWDWNLKTNEIYYSPRWKAMLGCADDEIGNRPEEWFNRIHPDDIGRVQAELNAHFEGSSPHFQNEHRILHKDGTYCWVLTRGIAIPDENGVPSRVAGSQSDITDRKTAEERLMHEAIHDVLTGLPNRALFMDLLARSIGRAKRREDYLFAVLFLDLDRFKVINDSLGHMIGDELLIAISRRLQSCLRPGDTVARLGGDEFTILLDDVRDVNDATRVAERIQEELALPFNLGGQEIFTSASIGIALSATGYDRPDDVLRDADTAMYRAKSMGKARHEVFDKAMHARAVALLQLETDLRRAIERNELCLYYQPTVSLKTGKIIGFEALIRWVHPERGIVLPVDFVPNAEETGLVIPIGKWVLREACQQMRTWQERLGRSLTISVNLSAKQLAQPDLIDTIHQILTETDLDPHHLILEITESGIIESPEAATKMLLQMKALNVQLHIDDFGTGYSSLSYLHRFPMDALKIDRSFISRMGTDEENLEIVRTIITLAHNLGMEVIAEGVETTEEVAQLRALQCEAGQGYYFSRPVDGHTALMLLSKRPLWLP